MIDYPNKLNIIFDKLDKFNIKPIIIGGYIRDFLLKRDSKDIDIEVYGISSLEKLESILAEFGEVNSVGRSFGVCKLTLNDLDLDFSLPRSDSKIDKGHKGFLITTDKELDFKTATSRRDFTINAIGYDVKEKKILDPFGGREDLKNSLLRAVDLDKFDEDPLRVLRAVQFSSRFGFTLEEKLFEKCKSMVKRRDLQELPRERIFEEIKKLLLKSPHPSHGFILLADLDIFHTDETTRTYLDRLAQLYIEDEETSLTLFLTLLSLELTKTQILSLIDKISNKQKLIKSVSQLVKYKDILDLDNASEYDILYAATRVKIIDYLYLLQARYKNADTKILILKQRAKELGVLDKPLSPLIQGKDLIKLGEKPSKKFSEILEIVYEAQLRAKFTDKASAFKYVRELLIS